MAEAKWVLPPKAMGRWGGAAGQQQQGELQLSQVPVSQIFSLPVIMAAMLPGTGRPKKIH